MSAREKVLLCLLGILLVAVGIWFNQTMRPSADELPAGSAREILVDNYNFGFTPSSFTVTAGEQLRFVLTNSSPSFHTFTLAPSAAEKGTILLNVDLQGNESTAVSFTVPDDVTSLYLYCKPHVALGMVGSFMVQAAPTVSVALSSPTPTVSSSILAGQTPALPITSEAVATASPASSAATPAPSSSGETSSQTVSPSPSPFVTSGEPTAESSNFSQTTTSTPTPSVSSSPATVAAATTTQSSPSASPSATLSVTTDDPSSSLSAPAAGTEIVESPEAPAADSSAVTDRLPETGARLAALVNGSPLDSKNSIALPLVIVAALGVFGAVYHVLHRRQAITHRPLRLR